MQSQISSQIRNERNPSQRVFLFLLLSMLFWVSTVRDLWGQPRDLTAVVLVNSSNSVGYNPDPSNPGEYQRYPERYFDHLQIAYRVVDVATASVQDLSSAQLIIAAHRGLNLSSGWQQAIIDAVASGTGFVNLDSDPAIGTNTHIQTIFGATGSTAGTTTIGASVGSVTGSTGLTVTSVTFPGITYDMWVDFQQCTAGQAPTAACLASSTHGAAGSWDVSHMSSLITIQTAAEDPAHAATGDTGTLGMAYNLANGGEGYIQWNLPAAKSSLSFGAWFKTGQPGAWTEGPHFITLNNLAFGNMLRLSDERSSATNARQIRVSPLDAAVTGVADNTWYWVTMKWVQGGAGSFSVYDTSLKLVGTVTFTDSFGVSAQSILMGNSSGTPGESGNANYIDDLIVDYTHSNFPLLP